MSDQVECPDWVRNPAKSAQLVRMQAGNPQAVALSHINTAKALEISKHLTPSMAYSLNLWPMNIPHPDQIVPVTKPRRLLVRESDTGPNFEVQCQEYFRPDLLAGTCNPSNPKNPCTIISWSEPRSMESMFKTEISAADHEITLDTCKDCLTYHRKCSQVGLILSGPRAGQYIPEEKRRYLGLDKLFGLSDSYSACPAGTTYRHKNKRKAGSASREETAKRSSSQIEVPRQSLPEATQSSSSITSDGLTLPNRPIWQTAPAVAVVSASSGPPADDLGTAAVSQMKTEMPGTATQSSPSTVSEIGNLGSSQNMMAEPMAIASNPTGFTSAPWNLGLPQTPSLLQGLNNSFVPDPEAPSPLPSSRSSQIPNLPQVPNSASTSFSFTSRAGQSGAALSKLAERSPRSALDVLKITQQLIDMSNNHLLKEDGLNNLLSDKDTRFDELSQRMKAIQAQNRDYELKVEDQQVQLDRSSQERDELRMKLIEAEAKIEGLERVSDPDIIMRITRERDEANTARDLANTKKIEAIAERNQAHLDIAEHIENTEWRDKLIKDQGEKMKKDNERYIGAVDLIDDLKEERQAAIEKRDEMKRDKDKIVSERNERIVELKKRHQVSKEILESAKSKLEVEKGRLEKGLMMAEAKELGARERAKRGENALVDMSSKLERALAENVRLEMENRCLRER